MQRHSVGPVMGQHYQYQYQPPPSSNQWRRRTEARYHSNHIVPQLSGTTRRGWSTNNEGAGSAQTPPSSNSPMADGNRPQKRQRKPYDRDHSGPSRRRPRRRRSDLSVYEVPIVELPTGTTAGGSNTPAVVPSPAPSTLSTLAPSAPSMSSTSGPSPSPPATAAPAPPTWAWMGIPVRPDEDAATDENTSMREQPDEEDYHTISSGSDTE
ncbi:hypothetical protein BYT27DRAFT_7205873 [Phlegmacium glaucopus]|nr:hypothetical protein BYT27DRAFT_7205873 [Phlegmacium glaucopus]